MEKRNIFLRIFYYFNKITFIYLDKVYIYRLEVKSKFLIILIIIFYLRFNGGGLKFKKYRLFYFYGDK